MRVQINNSKAQLPQRANPTDAGADLFSPKDVVIPPHSCEFIDLGIAMELPPNSCGLIFARSGLGTKHGIRPRNCVGVIDEKYRGNLGIMVENSNCVPYMIQEGDRIAQLVVVPILHPTFEIADNLDDTDDRNGGFGSSGR